ncbi:TonB-dependent receptor [Ideonella sp. 4Y16]|uniref:TonB-dependent receptor plug domain-containing protein n=1 Tax=Ideonella alba TaxID=2824118 RepID=UPI001B37DAAA|nr:TonB-dependent receptor [Ideonella alba]MBQ0943685.1 TonB-dependent receptor [Ideonella alba]
MSCRFPRAVLSLLCLVLAAPAIASPDATLAELPLEALLDLPVSGASRLGTRRSDSPASVTVIDRQQIEALGLRRLSDVLRLVRGIDISSDGSYSYAAVRGMSSAGDYNTRVLLLIDGNRVNDNVFDQAMLGTEFVLDLSQVERVEFIAGPGSAVYGANALFGVINVVTRASGASGVRGGLRLSHGAAVDTWVSLDTALAGGHLALGASLQHDRGEAVQEAWFGTGQAEGTARLARQSWSARWETTGWRMNLMSSRRSQGTPAGPDIVFGDTRARFVDSTLLVDVERRLVLDERLDGLVRAFAGRYRFLGDYPIDYPPVTLNRDYADGDWWGLEGRLLWSPTASHRVVVGAELQRQQRQRQYNADVQPAPLLYLDDLQRGWRWGVYVDDQWSPADDWTLHAGVRLDRELGRAHTSPRLALVWRAAPEWTWRWQHGRAFREPNAYERRYHGDGPGSWQLNPALHGEQVRADEIGIDWSRGAWRAAAAAYRNQADGLTVLHYDPATERYQVRNLGALGTQGIEAEVEALSGADRYRLQLGLNRTLRSTQWPGALTYPQRLLGAQAQWQLGERSLLAVDALARSRRGDAAGHLLLHARLSLRSEDRQWQLALGVRNLANRRWYDPGPDAVRQPLVRGEARQFWLEWSWEPSR